MLAVLDKTMYKKQATYKKLYKTWTYKFYVLKELSLGWVVQSSIKRFKGNEKGYNINLATI